MYACYICKHIHMYACFISKYIHVCVCVCVYVCVYPQLRVSSVDVKGSS